MGQKRKRSTKSSEDVNEIDIQTRKLTFDGKAIRVHIRDTTDPGRFIAMKREFYSFLNGALVVYDISNRKSYSNVVRWLKEIRKNAIWCKVAIILVGNKSDLSGQREIPKEEAQSFAAQNKLLFIETSALGALNVDTAFMELVTELLSKEAANGSEDSEPSQAENAKDTVQKPDPEAEAEIDRDTTQASALPPFDDEDLDFPRVSEWLAALDDSKRGRDGQNFAQYARALESAGYLRIDSLDNPAQVTSQKLMELTEMLSGHADNILKWVVLDISKIRAEAKNAKGSGFDPDEDKT